LADARVVLSVAQSAVSRAVLSVGVWAVARAAPLADARVGPLVEMWVVAKDAPMAVDLADLWGQESECIPRLKCLRQMQRCYRTRTAWKRLNS
jgi:hypothetical protein